MAIALAQVSTPVAAPTIPVAGSVAEIPAPAEKAKKERVPSKKLKDFPDWKSFCDYKIKENQDKVERAQGKVALWTKKREEGKSVQDAAQVQKKIDKLTEALTKLNEQKAKKLAEQAAKAAVPTT